MRSVVPEETRGTPRSGEKKRDDKRERGGR
jgi:hypothetical protein